MTITKIIENGLVYARRELGADTVVLEKLDPHIIHDAPLVVPTGTSLDVVFTLVDFDGAARSDGGGTLSLDVDGTSVSIPIEDGRALLPLDLFASIAVKQTPPYFGDARMDEFVVEVAP
jgi:hypothetical protein